ncbi:MAG: RsmE family RNA methyltransferase [Planctomycetota bacterium]
MSERFFSEQPVSGDAATLADQEAHHLLHVMRLKPGARVTLFDGSGAEFSAEVTRCGRRDVELAVLERHEIDRELPAPVVIASTLPKGDRGRWLIEKLTELGVARVDFLETERSVSKPTGGGMEKLRRTVIEASKQCRRNRLMQIAGPLAWEDYPAAASGIRLLAHPSPMGASLETMPRASDGPVIGDPVTVAVGPEGGFTDAEAAVALSCGWKPLDFGPRILRTETAAIAAATLAAQRVSNLL